MKIICLIRSAPPLFYFVNRINQKHKLHLVIIESGRAADSLIKLLISRGTSGIIDLIKNKISNTLNRKQYIKDYNKFFGNFWRKVDKEIPVLVTDNINSAFVHSKLREEKPDIILDHGTSIVREHIIQTAKIALNLHWGLSPYYRGTHCTEWALINRDPFNIGVTIHNLTKIVDGGDIWAQKRAVIKPTDTVHSINMQLTQMGTELIIYALEILNSGASLNFRKQDVSKGFVTCKKQWSKYLEKQIKYIKKNHIINTMLKKPARTDKLPIVEIQ